MAGSSVFEDNIYIKSEEEVDLPYSKVKGFVNLHKIQKVTADSLSEVTDYIELDTIESFSLSKLKSTPYLKIRNIENISLPNLTDCPIISLENVNNIALPNLTSCTLQAINVGSVSTNASGLICCDDECKLDCPNMKAESITTTSLYKKIVYRVFKEETINSTTTALYLENKELNQNLVELIFRSGKIQINVYGEDLEDAKNNLKLELTERRIL